MSRDISKLIYDMAYKHDTDLKEYYKYVACDNKKRVESAIKQTMKRNGLQTSLCINEYLNFDINDPILLIDRTEYDNFDESERMYCTEHYGNYNIMWINDDQLELRDIIKNVVVPLDLKWYIKYNHKRCTYGDLIVDWSHWKNE